MVTKANSLLGLSTLVLEDDFYQAEEILDMLEGAGAVVLGPFGNERDALDTIDLSPPDCAVLDVNLGHGPSFGTARRLKGMSIPLVMLTGYDREMMPSDLVNCTRLTKPVTSDKLIASLVAVTGHWRGLL